MNILFLLSLRIRVKIVLHLDQQLCQDSLKNLCQAREGLGASLAMFLPEMIEYEEFSSNKV